MKAAETLERARALVAKGWVQDKEAADAKGLDVDALSELACSWCALGALAAAANGHGFETYKAAREALARAAGEQPTNDMIARWNDSAGSVDVVLAAFDKAIAAEGVES